MGYSPKPRTKRVERGRFLFWTFYKNVPWTPPTYLEDAHRKFMSGEFDIEQLERRIATLLNTDLAEKPMPMVPPPKPKGLPDKASVLSGYPREQP